MGIISYVKVQNQSFRSVCLNCSTCTWDISRIPERAFSMRTHGFSIALFAVAASGIFYPRLSAESRNPTYYNIGGVLSNNDSEFHFQEIIAHLNFESQYVPRGVTYYARAIRMDPNPIRTALNVCKYLIAQRVYAVVVSHPQTGDLSPAAVSYTSGFYHIPVIGISSRDSAFSDKNIHVSFLRTVPPYSHQADVWVQLLRHLGYTRVLFVHGSDTDGRALLGRFQTASSQLPPGAVTLPGHLNPAGAAIIGSQGASSGKASTSTSDSSSSSVDDLDVKVQVEAVIEFEPGLESFTEQLTEMKTAQARVYLLYASQTDAEVIFRDAALLNMTEAGYVWLVTEQALDAENVPVGALGLRLVNATKERAHVQDSIYILASALRDMNAKENITEAPNDCDNSGSIWETGKLLFEYIRRQVLLNGKTGKVAFDDNGDRINAEYDVVNVQERGEQISVGQHYYCPDQDKMALKVDEGAILWPGRLRTKPEGFMIPTHLKVLTIEEKPFVYVREVKWGVRAQGPFPHSTKNPEEAFGSVPGASVSPSGIIMDDSDASVAMEGCHADEIPCPHFNSSEDGDEGGTMYCCKGFCVDLLKELAKTINFTYSLALSPDGQFGSYIAKNTSVGGKKEWTGLIGELVAERADMIVAPLTINPERAEFIEFSKPFKYQGITILEKKPSRSSTLVSFLQPFSNTLWILVMVSVHVVALVLYLLDRFSPFGRFRLAAPLVPPGASSTADVRGPPPIGNYCPSTSSSVAATTEEDALNLSSAIWFAWGVLLNSGIGEGTPRSFSARVLGMVWAGFAMIIVASYTANLAAFLVLERPKTKLTGINDARLRNTMENLTCATVKGSAVDMYFRRQVELSNMYRTMEGNNYDTAEDAIRDVKAGKLMAFIWDSSRLEFEAAMDCELVTAGELFGRSGYGVGLQKGSPWADAVTLAILDFHESGFMERLDNKWVLQQGDGLGAFGAHCDGANTSEKTPNTLGLKNMAGVFILVAAGILGGVALIVIEVAYKKHHARRQKRLELARHAADKWRGAVEKRRNLRATLAAQQQQQQIQQRRIKSNGINESIAATASRSPLGNTLGLAPTSVGGVGSVAAAAAAADLLRQRSPRTGGMRVSAITGSDDGSPLFSNPSPRRLPSPTDLIV